MGTNELSIIIKWEQAVLWILDTIEKYPKSTRFTFGIRIVNLALDGFENLIEAQYSKLKQDKLQSFNLNIEKLRMFFRLSHNKRYISYRQYEHISVALDECGKMSGGWLKHQQNNETV